MTREIKINGSRNEKGEENKGKQGKHYQGFKNRETDKKLKNK